MLYFRTILYLEGRLMTHHIRQGVSHSIAPQRFKLTPTNHPPLLTPEQLRIIAKGMNKADVSKPVPINNRTIQRPPQGSETKAAINATKNNTTRDD